MTDSVSPSNIIGGMTDCENDLEVNEIGKFAVDEYNKKEEATLEFERVVKAQSQIVSGVRYKLLLEAIDAGHKKKYEAVVYWKPWEDYKELEEFNPIINGGGTDIILGRWVDAGNDVGIEDIAKFAVDEYNKKEKSSLEFLKLRKAQKQLVAGEMYKLILEATRDSTKNTYEAKVFVSLKDIKKLVEFKLLLLIVEG